MTNPKLRAALYTRKSSEEGLEQTFNSLDAQREACAAYVKSQAHEGWRALPEPYDDGGFSGGSMERPALKRLLADIEKGRIDVVVVYKIDRLTRSLADFARIVEIFDRHKVSFVSVTQAFNTTSSMGRLTLNVLLSFAQFEREVTGERIRDKIAASKAKGMWMGGVLPFGYDLPDDASRTLKVNPVEAAIVERMFNDYLRLGSARSLERALLEDGVRTKARAQNGRPIADGLPFSRGALFRILRNPVYLGRIHHAGTLYPGRHAAIIDEPLYQAVQDQLDRQARRHRSGESGRTSSKHPLTGRIFDASGARMSPTFAVGARGRTYRYYVSSHLQRGSISARTPGQRVSAAKLESTIVEHLGAAYGPDLTNPLTAVTQVVVGLDYVEVVLPEQPRASTSLRGEVYVNGGTKAQLRLRIPFCHRKPGRPLALSLGAKAGPRPDPVLIRALRHGHRLLTRDASGRPTLMRSPDSSYEQKLVRLAFLAPTIQAAILSGRQPLELTLKNLMDGPMPLAWEDQQRAFGVISDDRPTVQNTTQA